jgi:hypothetical protein
MALILLCRERFAAFLVRSARTGTLPDVALALEREGKSHEHHESGNQDDYGYSTCRVVRIGHAR